MDMDTIAEIAVTALVATIKDNASRAGILVTAPINRVPMQVILRQSSGRSKPAEKTSETENT
jgi:LacI family transcriptional regulator